MNGEVAGKKEVSRRKFIKKEGKAMYRDVIGKKDVTRRAFIKTIAAAGVVAVGLSLILASSWAEARDYILIGHPAPITGPIASFGETATFVDEFATAEINKGGGIFIKELGKKLPIKIISMDTESNPTKASEIASRLILKEKVDLMMAAGTPDTINPVSAMCERYQVPCLTTFGPIEPWLTGGPYKWAFLYFVSLDQLINIHVGMWDEQAGKHNKVIGGLWPNDPDGTVWGTVFAEAVKKRGYKVVDVGRFPYGLQDFSAFINTWKKEKVEILTGVPIPPDFAACWKQCHQLGYIPKMVTISKAILFPACVEAIGDIAYGLICEILWAPTHPFKSSLTGISANQLAAAWTKKTGKQWTQPLGFDYAAFELFADALKRAGSIEKKKVREALVKTNLKTILAPIKFNEKNFCLTPMLGGQWVKGKKWPWELETVYNRDYPSIPLTAKMIFPLPGS
jgi:branched-chain amino acid transport system substrate-binding protein